MPGQVVTTPTVPPQGQPAPPEPPSEGIEVGLIPFVAGIVGLVVAAAVLALVLWVTREDAQPAAPTHTDATQPSGALADSPTLEVTVNDEVLRWEMAYPDLRTGDRFRIRTGLDEDRVSGEPVTLLPGETVYEQTLAPGQRQCGMVQVVRGGQVSGWSTVQCEEVGG